MGKDVVQDGGKVLIGYDDAVDEGDVVAGEKVENGLTKPVAGAEFKGNANRWVGLLLCKVYIVQKCL